MEQQKLEKVMAFAFVFIGIAFLLLLLSIINMVPFQIASLFIVVATVVALVTGLVIFRDSRSID